MPEQRTPADRGRPWIPSETTALLNNGAHPSNLALAMRRLVGPKASGELKQEQQKNVLQYLVDCSASMASQPQGLQARALAACGQRAERLAQAGRCRPIVTLASVAWRMVAGLGAASVLEGSGMTLHPLYGFPYVPGSSVKGLCRAVALAEAFEAHPALNEMQEADSKDRRPVEVISARINRGIYVGERPAGQRDDAVAWETLARISRVFGSLAKRGSWVFYDALPQAFPKLEIDIVNVHYPDYYQKLEPPGDWQSPKPVYFLTVPKGTRYSFRVGALPEAYEEDGPFVRQWLEEGLRDWGIGAKKSAGYGYFELDERQA